MNLEEIDMAAEKALADAGPEKIAQFLNAYPDPADEQSPAEKQSETPPIESGHLTDLLAYKIPDISFEAHLRDICKTIIGDNKTDKARILAVNFSNSEYTQQTVENYLADYANYTPETSDIYGTLIDSLRLDARDARERFVDYCTHTNLALLEKALVHSTRCPLKFPPQESGEDYLWYTPLSEKRLAMFRLLFDWILVCGAIAVTIESDCKNDWRELFLFVYNNAGGQRPKTIEVIRGFTPDVAARTCELIRTAHDKLHVDAAFLCEAKDIWGYNYGK